MRDPSSCPDRLHSKKLHLAWGLSQNTLFLWGVETYRNHSGSQILGLSGILEPTLFSDDTKLAQAARLSLFWRHLCWDQKVLFQIAREHWYVMAFRVYWQFAQLEVILELFRLLVSWCTPETWGSSQSRFHSPPPSVAWYLLMLIHLAVNELELCFCFQACMQMLGDKAEIKWEKAWDRLTALSCVCFRCVLAWIGTLQCARSF